MSIRRRPRWLVTIIGGLTLPCLSACVPDEEATHGHREIGAAHADAAPAAAVTLACPGRIEGATETVNVGAGISGVLDAVLVEDGQYVHAGDVLARLQCADLEAESSAAKSILQIALRSRERLLRGSRDEERREAQAAVREAESVERQTRAAYRRAQELFARKVASQDDLDRARRDDEVAAALLRRSRERSHLIVAPPLPEEVAKADAEVQLAQDRLLKAQRRFDKCTIRAPISGTVLQRHRHAGESVSIAVPHVIVSMADVSRYRARGEVDERDVGRIALGQPVLVSADAVAGEIRGSVAGIGQAMGRKSVQSGEPSEKRDRDVLEVLVDLEPTDQRLLVGLRVTLRFLEPG